MRVREYRPADRAACHAVFHAAVHEGAAGFYTPAQRRAWAPSATVDAQSPSKLDDQMCWVAEADRVMGFMSLTRGGYLDMAYVLPEMRGQGVAPALYDRLEARALAVGLRRLTTHASHLARRFLLKRGWRVDSPETIDHNGERLERFAMSKRLVQDAGDMS